LSWDKGTLKDWLLWAFDKGFLFLVLGKDGEPIGMTIARPLSKPTESRTEYHPQGSNIYVDLTIAKCKAAMKPLMAQIVNKFGVRSKIVFKRYGRSESIKAYDFRKFSLKILTS
jgi:hypothetical protein